MADTSPEWKKPADIMKLRRRRSLCPANLSVDTTDAVQRSRLSQEAGLPSRKSQKRKNPFACLSTVEKMTDVDKDRAPVKDGELADAEHMYADVESAPHCFIDVLVS